MLSLFKTQKGAQLEHASRNALLIIPNLWNKLKAPEKWQIGQVYATEFSEGRKDAVKGLHAVLVAVNGFDYVPESLRSNTFIKAAQSVVSAHQAMNNFYNEPSPMRELASLGTSIPGPAVAHCVTAILCVKLGNSYGTSWEAQAPADLLIKGMSEDRWLYYFNEKFDQDRIILSKLTRSRMAERWVELMNEIELDKSDISNKDVRTMVAAKGATAIQQVNNAAMKLLESSLN